MKPSYTGQRSKPATDQKFHPTDEHVIEKNKGEVDKAHYRDNTETASEQNSDKFDEIDKKPEKEK